MSKNYTPVENVDMGLIDSISESDLINAYDCSKGMSANLSSAYHAFGLRCKEGLVNEALQQLIDTAEALGFKLVPIENTEKEATE